MALVALAVLTAPGSAAPRVPPALGGQGTSARATTVPPFAGASLAIDPSSWWMEDGSNASFTAAWVDVPAGCLLSPAWYRWSVDGGEVGGTLTAANASESEFGAPQVGTGVTVLEVRSAAVVRCGANQTAQVANASVNLTIASAVELDALAVAPDPLAPGEAALLVGTVTGGTAPYRLRVDWGDGNVTDANLSGPGPFQVPYRYEENGTFEPVVLATDDGGRTATGTPLEPAHVGSGFVSAIEPSASEAEVGVPTTFTVGTLHAPANYSSVSWCDGASASGSGGAGGLVFGCTFADAGTFQVGFEAVGSTSPYLVTSSTLDEPVVPPPTLSFPCAAPASEVGRPVDVEVSLSGGVPPFTARLQASARNRLT